MTVIETFANYSVERHPSLVRGDCMNQQSSYYRKALSFFLLHRAQ